MTGGSSHCECSLSGRAKPVSANNDVDRHRALGLVTGKRSYRPKSVAEIRRNMSAIRSSDSKAETALRKRLHSMGLRYRKYVSGLEGRPDIVFPTQRVAVFVDGDYWHGRLLQERGVKGFRRTLTRNSEYWTEKMRRNVARDKFVSLTLGNEGWTVLRYWESDVKTNLNTVADEIADIVWGTFPE